MRRSPFHALRILLIALVATVPFGAAAQLGPPSESPDGVPEDVSENRQALIASGASPGLFMIYSGDVIGYLDPCG